MKIAFCTYDSPTFTGGPNSWLRRLLPDLVHAGMEIHVLFFVDAVSPDECPTYRDLKSQGIKCEAYPWQTTTEQRIHWTISVLTKNPPDIFVPNMIVPCFYASKWIKKAGIPTIGVLHSDDDFYRSVSQEFVFGQRAYQFSALVCVSEFLMQYVGNLGHTETLIKKIPYGVPVPKDVAKSPIQKLRLIYVGRLEEEQKRISEVAHALCKAVTHVPNTEAIIYGEGSAKSSIEIILQDYPNLPVRLGGVIDNTNIQQVMMEAHVLVLLSDYEGLPIALMEAMACGLVPICLDMRSGIPELVEHDITGLIVKDRDSQFVDAVQCLQNDPSRWLKLSKSARLRVKSFYSSKFCSEKWLSLMNELYDGRGVRSDIHHPRWLILPSVKTHLAREDRRWLSTLARKVYIKFWSFFNILKSA
jgi:colanic acid/amylovoran biosynthesis glycosyltransferase